MKLFWAQCARFDMEIKMSEYFPLARFLLVIYQTMIYNKII